MAHVATRTGSGLEVASGGARELVAAGGAVGLAGGALMAAVLPVGAALAERDPLEQLRAMGLTFLGSEAAGANPGLLAWGLFLHLVVSALLGVVFTSLLPAGFPYGSAAVVGVGYAWVVMAITTSLVVPAANPTLAAHMPALGGTWVIAHAIYGLAVGAGPPLRLRLRARR
jgi:hypothetical protein